MGITVSRVSFGLLFAAMIAGLAEAQTAELQLSLTPVGGTTVTPGGMVDVEVFGTNITAATIRIEGGQHDFPCIINPLPGGQGTLNIMSGCADCDEDGLNSSTGGIPYMFGPAGLSPFQPTTCVTATTPGIGLSPVNVAAGVTRYLATVRIAVSSCATGDFQLGFECTDQAGSVCDVAPEGTNTTRYREDDPPGPGSGPLIPLSFGTTTLSVPSGRCCSGGECIGEFNETCCLDVMGGVSWTAGATCAQGCPCTTPAECNDNNACTTDECVAGLCQNNNNTNPCNDEMFCTAVDACSGGMCVGTGSNCPGLLCNENLDMCVQCLVAGDCPPDGNACTDDICNPSGTCDYVFDSTNICDDGLFCTRTDRCMLVDTVPTCMGTPRVCPGTTPLCCEDVDACRECCLNSDCEDNNACTDDQCVNGVCMTTPVGGICEDGLFCTFMDMCTDGQCMPGAASPCTQAQMCDEDGDRCVECFTPEDCIQDECVQENCMNGVCVYQPEGAGTSCGSQEVGPCDNRDTCDGAGTCQPNPKSDGTPCPDEFFCNGAEICGNGACKPAASPCMPGEFCNEAGNSCDDAPPCNSPTECPDDGNPCTDTACVAGACQYPPNTAPCNDGDGCTTNDACSGGICVGGPPVVCEQTACTTSMCVSGVCQSANRPDGTACGSATANECDAADSCLAGVCQSNNVANGTACTSDGNACTNDVCNGGACTHPGSMAGTPCGSAATSDCDGADTCNGSGVCQSNNLPNGTTCTTDGVECTSDVCNNGTCAHPAAPAGTFCGSAAVTDCDNRDTCDAAGACQSNNRPDGTTCTTDNNDCTDDMCGAGVCTHPNRPSGSVCGSPGNTDCDNPDTCNGSGACQINNEPNGMACTTDANDCTNDVCRNGSCAHDPVAGGTPCGSPTDDLCNNPDTCNGIGVCQANLESDGTPCSNGMFCDGPETCRGGACTDGADPCRDIPHCSEAADMCLACIADDECLDTNPCTMDTCTANVCANTPIPDCVSGLGNRVSVTQKGSLLIFSKVEIKWELFDDGKETSFQLAQDTFFSLVNDYPDDVDVQLYFINGDQPRERETVGIPPFEVEIERAHPGWNWVDCQFNLTANQTTYGSILTGQPAGCPPFTVLDPGFPPGRPDPEVPGGRILRGYVLAWAVNRNGEEIRWNNLSGSAVVVNYAQSTAWEYNAYAFQAISADHGEPSDGVPGQLLLDGIEYDNAYDRIIFDFYATGTNLFSTSFPGRIVTHDTDVTLHPVSADLRQETDGPVITKALYDVWNENERRFSEMTRCINCWDQTLASRYGAPNFFLRTNLLTDKGKARVDGVLSQNCPGSIDAALLGVIVKHITFSTGLQVTGFASSALTYSGQGLQEAVIKYDIVEGPEELLIGPPAAVVESPTTPDNAGKRGK